MEETRTWEERKEQIRRSTDFVALVEETVGPLKKRPNGSPVMISCPWHDDRNPSLAIYPDHATCFGACNQTWDLFAWAMKAWGADFAAVFRKLADQAGTIPIPPSDKERDAPGLPGPGNGLVEETPVPSEPSYEDGLAVVAKFFARCLWETPAALEYAHGRGWNDETIRLEQVGYTIGRIDDLQCTLHAAGFPPTSKAFQVAQNICDWARKVGGAITYVHRRDGQVVYLSARSIKGKMHHNPPTEQAGPKLPYFNARYNDNSDVIVVEGQADAITLSQWELAGVALAGSSANENLIGLLRRRLSKVWLALDSDPAGSSATRKLADQLGPLTHILNWPDGKDANAALVAGVSRARVKQAQQKAREWIEVMAKESSVTTGATRDEALQRCFAAISQLDSSALVSRRNRLAKLMDIPLRDFNQMLAMAKESKPGSSVLETLLTKPVPGGYTRNGTLFEMIVTPEPRALFAVRSPEGRISLETHLDQDGVHYVPLDPRNDLIQKRVVYFPSELGEVLDEVTLQARVQSFIHHYVDVGPLYEKMASYYVLFSYLFDCFSILPYLRALGDYGTGKTRFLQTIGILCFRPMFVAGASTTSPIFRIIDLIRGTLILDEADFLSSEAFVDIIKILNCGYMAGFPVLRTAKDEDRFEVVAMEVFGPKLIGTRFHYKDKALESRMLTHEMISGPVRSDIPLVLPKQFYSEALVLRNLLLRYRLTHWRPEAAVDITGLDRSIEPRLNQITLSLLTIVEDERLREDIRNYIRDYNRQLIVDRSMSTEASVLEALVRLPEKIQVVKWNSKLLFPLIALTEETNKKLAALTVKGEEAQLLTPKKVGYILRERLQLHTIQRGPYYFVEWDQERIDGLMTRYGLVGTPGVTS